MSSGAISFSQNNLAGKQQETSTTAVTNTMRNRIVLFLLCIGLLARSSLAQQAGGSGDSVDLMLLDAVPGEHAACTVSLWWLACVLVNKKPSFACACGQVSWHACWHAQ